MRLSAEHISKKFNRKTNGASYFCAVHETDFDLRENALTAVFGRSGSGKTTLLNMLGGLLAPNAGRVLLGGTDLYALPDKELARFRNQNIGVIPQGSTPLANLSVLDNVLLPTLLYGKRDEETVRYATELLDTVGIADLRDALPCELSGGELRRMAIARALVTKPAVLLADEPTGDLDDENTRMVLELLSDVAGQGTAVLMVTHEREAAAYAGAVYRMDAGVLKKAES